MNAPPEKQTGAPLAGNAGCYEERKPDQEPSETVNGFNSDLAHPSWLMDDMSETEFRTYMIRRCVLLTLLGIETKSFSELAESLHVTPACLSKIYTRLADALGFAPLFRKVETRRKNREAALRHHAAKGNLAR